MKKAAEPGRLGRRKGKNLGPEGDRGEVLRLWACNAPIQADRSTGIRRRGAGRSVIISALDPEIFR
jgi:hypothetical protein